MKKKIIALLIIFLVPRPVKADFWGGDLPLLAQIVTNTLQTLHQLQSQTSLMRDDMAGIQDRINRIQAIVEVVQPSTWDKWKDPEVALRRLKIVYYTLPKEYRSEKSDQIEEEISKAMALVAKVSKGAGTSFQSGKEMERRGADSSPGVAQKLTASGVGTLITMEAQNQVIQSHIVSLLSQMLADGNEKESRGVISRGECFSGISKSLGDTDGKFSSHAFPAGMKK